MQICVWVWCAARGIAVRRMNSMRVQTVELDKDKGDMMGSKYCMKGPLFAKDESKIHVKLIIFMFEQILQNILTSIQFSTGFSFLNPQSLHIAYHVNWQNQYKSFCWRADDMYVLVFRNFPSDFVWFFILCFSFCSLFSRKSGDCK